MKLHGLHPDARRLVTPELVSGQLRLWPERAYADLLTEAPCPRDTAGREGSARDRGEVDSAALDSAALDSAALDGAVDQAIRTFAPFDPQLDGWLAPRLHRALPLSRRDASAPGLWRFLAVVHRPGLIRHRWEHRSLRIMKARFWSIGTRADHNTFCRLWWIAELTRDGADYDLTRRVLSRQRLARSLFTRELSWHRPLVAACADALADAPVTEIDRTMSQLARALSTIVLESRSEAELRELVGRLRG